MSTRRKLSVVKPEPKPPAPDLSRRFKVGDDFYQQRKEWLREEREPRAANVVDFHQAAGRRFAFDLGVEPPRWNWRRWLGNLFLAICALTLAYEYWRWITR